MHTDGGTPLHQAARARHMAPMRLLLEAAAETDLRDTSPQGSTPLLLAASEGHVDCVDLLIQAGVDTDMATLDCGIAPLHRASLRGHLEVACLLIEVELTSTILQLTMGEHHYTSRLRGTMSNLCACWSMPGQTATRPGTTTEPHPCSKQLRRTMLRWFACWLRPVLTSTRPQQTILKQCPCTLQLKMAMTKLQACWLKLELKSIELPRTMEQHRCSSQLREATSKLSACWLRPGLTWTNQERMPLEKHRYTSQHVAAENGHAEVVRLLIEARVNILKSCTAVGTTPFHIAALNGHDAVARLLREAGAGNKAGSHRQSQFLHWHGHALFKFHTLDVDSALKQQKGTKMQLAPFSTLPILY